MVSSSLALLYLLLGIYGGGQASGPNRGQVPVEWEDFLSVCPSVPPSGPSSQAGWTENLPILQDFVPYRGRCPTSPHENQGESRAGQGNC